MAAPVLLTGFAVGCTVVSVAQILHFFLATPIIYVTTGKVLIHPDEIVEFWTKSDRASVEPTRAQQGEDPTIVAAPLL